VSEFDYRRKKAEYLKFIAINLWPCGVMQFRYEIAYQHDKP
jgi:hypothetical protein